eukprot:Phypoly_transcript_05005.p1 GENE.Phypoly_transcript_05005~~Phypoly_transcript_05005.p1  ORF type:complete len:611 (+),score=58.71 Phypoly_transcript_05005:217-2049(+)
MKPHILCLVENLLRRCFSLDGRSLALFRICLGFATLCDLLERSFFLRAHYTELGTLPRGVVTQHLASPYHLCVHFLNDTLFFQSIVFLLHAFFVSCVIVGWKTKLFSILSFIWITSLHSRNPLLLHGGDTIVRVIWFYAMYLPTETCFSIDAYNRQRYAKHELGKTKSYAYFGLGSIAYFIQLTFVYVTAYSEKASVRDWQTGVATYYVLQIGYFATSFATFLLKFPGLVNLMTRLVLYWELIGPLLLYWPVFNQPLRLLGITGLMAMHLGFASCLRLGVFTLCACAALTAGIPSFCWDFVFSRLQTRERRQLSLYYDSNSQVGDAVYRFLTTFCLIPGTLIYDHDSLSLPTRNDKPTIPWLTTTDSKGQTKENISALIVALNHAPLFWWVPKILSKNLLSRILFYFVSPFQTTPPYAPPPRSLARERLALYGKRVASVAIIIAMTALIIHNGNPSVPDMVKFDFERLKPILQVFRIDQQWIMFSRPPKHTMWLAIRGTLRNGELVDVFKEQGVARIEGGKFTGPELSHVHDNYLNHRWYKYFENGFTKPNIEIKHAFTKWLCREWNYKHTDGEILEKVDVFYYYSENHLDLTQEKRISTNHMYQDGSCT